MGEKIKRPTDWAQILKILHKKEKKLLSWIHSIPEKLNLISTDRRELIKFKTLCFGKWKISLTTISASFQKESRIFANLFALVILMLQKMKKEKLQQNSSNLAKKESIEKSKNEESSNYNESDGTFPKDSWDETNSYYNGSRYNQTSSEYTPEQVKPNKPPIKAKTYKSPTKKYVKKGYLSTENQSTDSKRSIKKKVNDYVSPVKQSKNKKKLIHNSHTVKKEVDLKYKNNQPHLFAHLNLESQKPQTKLKIESDYDIKTPKSRRKSPRLNKSSTYSALKSHYERENWSAPEEIKRGKKSKLIPPSNKVRRNNINETTDESEDPLHDQIKRRPNLKVYDKNTDGGMLYAFLNVIKWSKPTYKSPQILKKAESYNPTDSNFQAYKKTIVNAGLTGIARHSSEVESSRPHNPTTLSEEDYQKVLDLKNKRMKALLCQK